MDPAYEMGKKWIHDTTPSTTSARGDMCNAKVRCGSRRCFSAARERSFSGSSSDLEGTRHTSKTSWLLEGGLLTASSINDSESSCEESVPSVKDVICWLSGNHCSEHSLTCHDLIFKSHTVVVRRGSKKIFCNALKPHW